MFFPDKKDQLQKLQLPKFWNIYIHWHVVDDM